MRRVVRRQLAGSADAIAATFALVVCLLLVNAVVIAPATHHHEEEHHNHHSCLICKVTWTGSWVPAQPAEMISDEQVVFEVPTPEAPERSVDLCPFAPVRGPPVHA
jgi:hypothetical protein